MTLDQINAKLQALYVVAAIGKDVERINKEIDTLEVEQERLQAKAYSPMRSSFSDVEYAAQCDVFNRMYAK